MTDFGMEVTVRLVNGKSVTLSNITSISYCFPNAQQCFLHFRSGIHDQETTYYARDVERFDAAIGTDLIDER